MTTHLCSTHSAGARLLIWLECIDRNMWSAAPTIHGNTVRHAKIMRRRRGQRGLHKVVPDRAGDNGARLLVAERAGVIETHPDHR